MLVIIFALIFSILLLVRTNAVESISAESTYLPNNQIFVTVNNDTGFIVSADIEITYKDSGRKYRKTYYADKIEKGTSYAAFPYSGKKKPKKLKTSVVVKQTKKNDNLNPLADTTVTVIDNKEPNHEGLCRQMWLRIDEIDNKTIETPATLLFYSDDKLVGAKSIFVHITPDEGTSMYLSTAPFVYADRDKIGELEDKYPIDRVELAQGY